jgi:hypothetical protein
MPSSFYLGRYRVAGGSVVDRHRSDADPELTFHSDADPDPDQDPPVMGAFLRKVNSISSKILTFSSPDTRD